MAQSAPPGAARQPQAPDNDTHDHNVPSSIAWPVLRGQRSGPIVS
jgi:hypothetical protein